MGKWKKVLASVLAGVLLFSTAAISQNDFGTAKTENLGKLPVMGWSSWNLYQGDVSEADIKAQADALVKNGLADKGYTYVLLDDGALAAERDAEGYLQPNDKFSNGFKNLGDYLHGQKLQFGMQNSAGTKTGSGLPGSYNYEMRDAQTYADWGVDLLKYVFCNNPLVTEPLDSIVGEIDKMGPEAPAINRIVIKEVKDDVSTYIKTVHISSDNTVVSDGASFGQISEYMTGLDAKEDLSAGGKGTLTFNMEKIDPMAKYTVDVYCFNSDKPRWLAVQVNPQVEDKSNKFYVKSDITGDQADIDAVSRSIYDVPLQEGENKISFYLDKEDVKKAYQQDAIRSFNAMSKAMKTADENMILSICDWGWNKPHTGWGEEIARYWRTTADMTRTKGKVEWSSNDSQNGLSVLAVYEKNVGLDEYAGPFGYNDPDALAVGLEGLTEEQNRSHFTLWCMMAAPLLLSADLTDIEPNTLAIVGNENMIALDQDELCLQAKRFDQSDDKKIDYLVKPLADGSVALCIFNKGETEQAASVSMKDVTKAAVDKVESSKRFLSETQRTMFTNVFANSEAYSSVELWSEETGEVKSDETISATIPASGVKVFKLAPAVEQEISVKVTPETTEVERGAQMEFKATVTGAKENDTVNWEIDGVESSDETITRIDDNGVLTVAADEELKEITVKTTSIEDPTKSATATVKVIEAKKPSVVNVLALEPIEVNEETAFEDLELPSKVNVNTLENSTTGTAEIDVVWNEPAEPLTEAGLITGDLQIGEEFYNPANIKAEQPLHVVPAPHTLTVKFNADSAGLIEDTGEDNNTGIYTEKIMGGEAVSLQFTPNHDREFSKAFVNGKAKVVEDTNSFTYNFDMPNGDTKVFVAFRTVDKAVLRKAIDQSLEFQSSDDYKEVAKENRNKFEKTLKEAQDILEKINTDQTEIKKAYTELFNAMENMGLGIDFLLENMVVVLEELSSNAYTDDSWGLLPKALEDARYLLEDGKTDIGKLKATYNSLRAVFSNLEYKADLTKLTEPLEKAQKINDRLKDYQEAGKEEFLEAFTNALAMDVFNTQEAVDVAREELNQAIDALEIIPVDTRLKKLIQEAKSKNLSDYDSASRTRLSKALDEANKALASGKDQEMEKACRTLEEALAKLEEYKKPDRPKKDTTSNPMTYGEGTARADVPALIAAQAVQATISVRSDTTMPFVLKRGKAYCFKMTVLDGRTEIPSFTVGNNSVLKTQFVAQIGSDCYFRVWAVGKPGQGTGVYTAMPGEFPQLKCLVTVG
ncbi:glycoside hydrolase family 27 protein [Anaeromassilibacillus senegalensis]|uniref:glycoside hydrolase family 27 protein n=1 Tax=Anaeromassilibacillus senegalensis TaxID=1673717 RepID=UPI0006803840|nr:glycoside hydrolase family 27 protein [Anaeromassilibacillus senegalensis]